MNISICAPFMEIDLRQTVQKLLSGREKSRTETEKGGKGNGTEKEDILCENV